MPTGLLVVVAAVLVTAAVGLWRARTQGRFGPRGRAVPAEPSGSAGSEGLAALHAVGAQPGERATLLQFSSAFCAPCRTTRVVLAAIADDLPGVAHVEVDAESHLDLVRSLGILRTPTTLVLDGRGAERARAAGAPRREQVLDALERL